MALRPLGGVAGRRRVSQTPRRRPALASKRGLNSIQGFARDEAAVVSLFLGGIASDAEPIPLMHQRTGPDVSHWLHTLGHMTGDDQPLNLAGSFVDLGYLGIAEVAFHRIFGDVAIAAENLNRLARRFIGDIRGI
jgi:hypothetical protein